MRLLPYLDQGNVWNLLDQNSGHTADGGSGSTFYMGLTGNEVLQGFAPSVYSCPSDSYGNFASPSDTSSFNGVGGNPPNTTVMIIDYVGISGAELDSVPGQSSECTGEVLSRSSVQCRNGMMAPFEGKKLRDCTDGASNTIVVAEQSGQVNGFKRSANSQGGWAGYVNSRATWWTAGTPLNPFPSTFTSASQTNCSPSGITTVRNPPNSFWLSGAPTQASSAVSANTVLNSFHVGGIHILLSDGSVRFLSENIDMNTLRRLCVRDDGLTIGDY